MTTKDIGNRGEDIAVEFLCAQGYTIVERNWHCGRGVHCTGEIDIIATKGDTLHFIEVKSRASRATSGDFSPEAALTEKKIERIRLAIDGYLQQQNYLGKVSMSLIAINLQRDEPPAIRLYEDIRIW